MGSVAGRRSRLRVLTTDPECLSVLVDGGVFIPVRERVCLDPATVRWVYLSTLGGGWWTGCSAVKFRSVLKRSFENSTRFSMKKPALSSSLLRHVVVLSIASFLTSSVSLAQEKSLSTVPAISRPSKELKLAFPGLGIIKDVSVKEGDEVKKDQLLMSADDRMDVKALEALRIDAQSTVNYEAAVAEAQNKGVELRRLEKMKANEVASDLEVERAKLEVVIAGLKTRQAKQEQEQKKLEYERQAVKVELMKLTSPIDGVVARLNIKQGEAVDPQNREGAIVVVLNDPLWIEVRDLPTRQATRLKLGQILKVRYTDATEQDWQDAKVIFFSPVADAASDTLLVRLELPNPSHTSAGLHLEVMLPEGIATGSNEGRGQTAAGTN